MLTRGASSIAEFSLYEINSSFIDGLTDEQLKTIPDLLKKQYQDTKCSQAVMDDYTEVNHKLSINSLKEILQQINDNSNNNKKQLSIVIKVINFFLENYLYHFDQRHLASSKISPERLDLLNDLIYQMTDDCANNKVGISIFTKESDTKLLYHMMMFAYYEGMRGLETEDKKIQKNIPKILSMSGGVAALTFATFLTKKETIDCQYKYKAMLIYAWVLLQPIEVKIFDDLIKLLEEMSHQNKAFYSDDEFNKIKLDRISQVKDYARNCINYYKSDAASKEEYLLSEILYLKASNMIIQNNGMMKITNGELDKAFEKVNKYLKDNKHFFKNAHPYKNEKSAILSSTIEVLASTIDVIASAKLCLIKLNNFSKDISLIKITTTISQFLTQINEVAALKLINEVNATISNYYAELFQIRSEREKKGNLLLKELGDKKKSKKTSSRNNNNQKTSKNTNEIKINNKEDLKETIETDNLINKIVSLLKAEPIEAQNQLSKLLLIVDKNKELIRYLMLHLYMGDSFSTQAYNQIKNIQLLRRKARTDEDKLQDNLEIEKLRLALIHYQKATEHYQTVLNELTPFIENETNQKTISKERIDNFIESALWSLDEVKDQQKMIQTEIDDYLQDMHFLKQRLISIGKYGFSENYGEKNFVTKKIEQLREIAGKNSFKLTDHKANLNQLINQVEEIKNSIMVIAEKEDNNDSVLHNIDQQSDKKIIIKNLQLIIAALKKDNIPLALGYLACHMFTIKNVNSESLLENDFELLEIQALIKEIVNTFSRIGEYQYRQGQSNSNFYCLSNAVTCFYQGIIFDEINPVHYFNLARAYCNLGMQACAIAALDDAVYHAQNNEKLLAQINSLKSLYKAAIEENPNSPFLDFISPYEEMKSTYSPTLFSPMLLKINEENVPTINNNLQ